MNVARVLAVSGGMALTPLRFFGRGGGDKTCRDGDGEHAGEKSMLAETH